MRVLSFITEPPVVRKILEHLHRAGLLPVLFTCSRILLTNYKPFVATDPPSRIA